MKLEVGANVLAAWLAGLSDQGRPCPTNLVQSAVKILKCSPATARAVKKHLTAEGRLVINPMRGVYMIDGKYFNGSISSDADRVERIKSILRRFYCAVYDARTVDAPDKKIFGKPQIIVLGSQRVPFPVAERIAREKAKQLGVRL